MMACAESKSCACLGDLNLYICRSRRRVGLFPEPRASEGSLGVARKQDIARWITSKRRRRWLHRLRAECPGGVPLWAANFRYSELPCILLVTDFLVLRAC